jgi:uncharacterized membrane protein
MNLEGYKLIFVAVGLIGVLLIATPALANVIHFPSGEQFSELYLLGPNHMASNYPYDISEGQTYSVYVDVGNNLGSSAYYVLYLKLGNMTDLMPNATLGTPSSLQPIYEYIFSIQNGANWESQLNFSVSSASILGNNSQINTLKINDSNFNIDKPAVRDSNNTEFRYNLLFELWVFNDKSNSVEYNGRFVDLHLNLTSNTF